MDNEIKINIEEEITNINVEQNDITIELNQEPDFVLNLEKQGPKGERGEAGADGENATIEIGTVEYGEDISVTNSGTPTHAVLDFVFPLEGGGEDGILGIEAWYKTTYGIIDTGNVLIENPVNTLDIVVPAGFVLKIPNKTTKVTIASDINYSVTSSSNFTLFYVDGGYLLEAGEVYYQTEEPSYNGIENYQAWFNPEGNVWSFRSNDTGNVWRVEEATPIADIFIGNGNITRIDYIGYRLLNNQLWKNSGGGLEIGDIGIAPLGIDETLGKRRYLNGQVIIQEQYQVFSDKVKSAIVLYPNLACTEQEWQATATLSAFGQCGKFVVDDVAGTIRLPKVINIQGLQDLSLMGSIKAESLPNITGALQSYGEADVVFSGAFSKNTTYSRSTSGGQSVAYLADFNASLSSSIYQDNAPVQQEAVQYPYFIQVATGAEAEVDIVNEIELNNPYTLFDSKYTEAELFNASWLKSNGQYNNGSVYVSAYQALLIENNTDIEVGTTVNNYTKRGLSVKLSIETYTDYDFVLNTSDETFRLPIKTNLADDNNENLLLYFYVGETVQNSNLINAGRIEEKLSDCITRQENIAYIVETYQNGTSWYRVWSDGWCEQGGIITVTSNGVVVTTTFLKTYISMPSVFINFTYSTGGTVDYMYIQARNITNEQFVITGYATSTQGTMWRACGYIR